METRKPYFAGSWYPATAYECETQIKSFLKDTRFHVPKDTDWIGGIVPHAGWAFSGSLACNVISALKEHDDGQSPDTVVVFGMHMPPNASGTIMGEGAWGTPFGDLPIDEEMAAELAREYRLNVETPTRFTPENTIELQLPLIKYFFPKTRILPIGPPADKTAVEIGKKAARLAEKAGKRIRIVGSTDLTHYGPDFGFTSAGSGRKAYEWVKNENDRRVIDAMLAMDAEEVINEGLAHRNACCPGAAAAAIASVKALGASSPRFVGYSSSFEERPGDTFVGYGGVVFH